MCHFCVIKKKLFFFQTGKPGRFNGLTRVKHVMAANQQISVVDRAVFMASLGGLDNG